MTRPGTWNLARAVAETAPRSTAAEIAGSAVRWAGGGIIAACLITAVYAAHLIIGGTH